MSPDEPASVAVTDPPQESNQSSRQASISTRFEITSDDARTQSVHRAPTTMDWVPAVLSHSMLLGNIVFFLACISGLEIMDYVSKRDRGLATTDQKYHYLWTYGPTLSQYLPTQEPTYT